MKQDIEMDMKHQMTTLLGGLSFIGSIPSSIPSNKISCVSI